MLVYQYYMHCDCFVLGIKIQFFPENGCQKRKMLSVLVYLPGCFKFPGRPFDCIQNSYR